MGLLPTPNHLALIRDCYPVKQYTSVSLQEIKADSNSVGKLCYYGAGRPKKLPKVAAAVQARVEADVKGSNAKSKAALAVSLDVMRALVVECAQDLHCFAEHALKVIDLSLGSSSTRSEPELEARTANVFHAIATYATGPFLGVDQGLNNLYNSALSSFCAMAKGASDPRSRLAGLHAVEAAVASVIMYSTAAEFRPQITVIMPAVMQNCIKSTVADLSKTFDSTDADAHSSAPGPVANRKSATVSVSEKSPTNSELSTKAVRCFRTVCRRSQALQLCSMLSAISTWLDQTQDGALWREIDSILWIAQSSLSASAVQYRSAVVGWWVEQVVNIGQAPATPKGLTKIQTLNGLLRGPTSVVGLGVGGAFTSLSTFFLQRVPCGDDELVGSLLTTISALGHHQYYTEQMSDLVSDVVDVLKLINRGAGDAANLDERDRQRAMKWFVTVLRGVMSEADVDSRVHVAEPLKRSNSAKSHASGRSRKSDKRNKDKENGDVVVASNKDAEVDAMGRPVMRVAEASKRRRIAPEVFQHSLFLMTSGDADVRQDYQRILIHYLSKEVEVPHDGVATKELARFYAAVHTAVYELATSTTLSDGMPSSRSRVASISRQSHRSRRSSKASRRPSASAQTELATPSDLAYARDILFLCHSRPIAASVVNGVPPLLALNRDALRWTDNKSLDDAAARVQACHEIVASALRAIALTWNVNSLEKTADDALGKMRPSVLGEGDAFRSVSTASSPVNAASVARSLATSTKLQAGAGADEQTLTNTFTTEWALESAKTTLDTPSIVYREAGSRSITNLSSNRLSRLPNSTRSFKAPSLADLHSSLGRTSSVRTASIAPSLASTNQSGVETRRRTVSVPASAVLEAVGKKNAARLSVMPTSPPSSNRVASVS